MEERSKNEEKVVEVGEDGEIKDTINRGVAHSGEGIKHDAFTLLILDSNGENILLTQRSEYKQLWGGSWDGTIASHPDKKENYRQASIRRSEEELGIIEEMFYEKPKKIGFIDYRAYDPGKGVEKEHCAVLISKLKDENITPNKKEISDTEWVKVKDIIDTDISKKTCPWFEGAFKLYLDKNIEKGKDYSNKLPHRTEGKIDYLKLKDNKTI